MKKYRIDALIRTQNADSYAAEGPDTILFPSRATIRNNPASTILP